MRANQKIDYHFTHWSLPGSEANALMDRIAEECKTDNTEQTIKNLEKYNDLYIDIDIEISHTEDDKIWCNIYKKD